MNVMEHIEALESTAATARAFIAAGNKLPPGKKMQLRFCDGSDDWADECDEDDADPLNFSWKETEEFSPAYCRLVDITEPPKYAPFTDADRKLLRGKWIRNVKTLREECIQSFSTGMANGFHLDRLHETHVFVDGGSPVGAIFEASMFPVGTVFHGDSERFWAMWNEMDGVYVDTLAQQVIKSKWPTVKNHWTGIGRVAEQHCVSLLRRKWPKGEAILIDYIKSHV